MMLRDAGELKTMWIDALEDNHVCTSVTEWADTYRFLSRNASAEPGPWRTAKTPYLYGIHDAMSINNPCWKVVIKGGAQCGKTEAANNLVCYRVDQYPCPILWVVPRDKDVHKYVNTRIDPMLSAIPRIRNLIGRDERGQAAADSAVLKRFPGGQLMIAGSTSPAVFRSDPIEIVVLDDLDAFGHNAEGDIVGLATRRTNTFSEKARKVVCVSTPTVDGSSAIEREFQTSSQNRFNVPCPSCGGFQVLEWSRLIWVKEAPQDVRYKCARCGHEIAEGDKETMVKRGEWRPDRPEMTGRVEGFHLPAFISPWVTWSDIVEAWLAATRMQKIENDTSKMQEVYNTIFGETFVLASKARLEGVEKEVYDRREPPFDRRTLPVQCVTLGVDVQANRLEASVYAWGSGMESWLLEHAVMKGAVEENGIWDELSALAISHDARAMCVDAGDQSQTVRDQVQRIMHPLLDKHCIAWAIQGHYGNRSLWPRPTKPGDQVTIGVDQAKEWIYGSLERITSPGPKYVHIPTTQSKSWFHQLFSERRAEARDRTRARFVKVAGRRRNEALDCAVYAMAAVYGLCALDKGLYMALLNQDAAVAIKPAQEAGRKKFVDSWISGSKRPRSARNWVSGGRRRRR